MDPIRERIASITRRHFFRHGAMGLGGAALASLLAPPSARAADAPVTEARKRVGGLPGLPHFAPKAKRAIYLLQNGAPPHIDTFDYKPQMEAWRGKELP